MLVVVVGGTDNEENNNNNASGKMVTIMMKKLALSINPLPENPNDTIKKFNRHTIKVIFSCLPNVKT